MKDFEYVRPASVAEAIATAAVPGGAYLAGGTNLLDLMKGNIVGPVRLVDVTRLPGLDRIDWGQDGSVRIGALVRNSDLAYDVHFAKTFPAIAEALLSGASAQLRNAATAAGNVMQRTRCQYFYDPASACNKREPGAGCDAVGGLDRLAAVLGWSPNCIATHPSDFCVPLVALGAIVEIEGETGGREVPLEAFHCLPGATPHIESALEPGDLITAIRLPAEAASFSAHSRYMKLRERTSYAFAVVSVATALKLDDGRVAEARVALGGVAAKPWRAAEAERVLAGQVPSAVLFRGAAEAALADAKSVGGNGFKIDLARRIIVRGLTLAMAGTPQRLPALPGSALRRGSRPMSDKTAAIPELDRIRHGSSIGQPTTRREGLLKVTGRAHYAADHHPPGMLHAVMAVAAIARGTVTHLDVAAAKAHPGVRAVMTPANVPKLAISPDKKPDPFSFKMDLLQSAGVRYAHQPIAVVIAETLEAATEGAALLAPRYAAEPSKTHLDQAEPFGPPAVGIGSRPNESDGDVEAGLAKAAAKIAATYDIAPQYHNPLEPHVIIAKWEGDKLIIDTPSQGMSFAQGRLAGLFGMDPKSILIRSPFLGGGFGSKGVISGPQVLGILAAKLIGRPVKLVMRREQMFGPVGHRGATRQTLRLGATADGDLTALAHHTISASSSFDDFFEPAGTISRHLYASPAISSSHEGVRLDVGTPIFMRAPGEAPGSLALESAMDELAHELKLDPLELRLKNYAEVEPMTGKPYSSKALRQCYAKGAERFGWAGRPLLPRQMRDSEGLLVGWGMGTATFPALMFQAQANAVLYATGKGRVEIGGHDMGQGAWTSLAQIAAGTLGIAYDDLDFVMGTSDLPSGGIAGGSAGTATCGSAIQTATADVIRKLTQLATNDQTSPLFGAGNAGIVARDGRLFLREDESRGEPFTAILTRAGKDRIEGRGASTPGPTAQNYALHAHGAVFAEVKVDPDLGQMRVTRLVGAFAAGTVINPRLVQSQYYGGMIWGVSMVLHEHAAFDRRSGRPMNASLAEYHVPVNADVPSIEAIIVDEYDPYVNALGIKGVGEIGITGSAGAVANAVWHATGVRVRDIPITLDKLLG